MIHGNLVNQLAPIVVSLTLCVCVLSVVVVSTYMCVELLCVYVCVELWKCISV